MIGIYEFKMALERGDIDEAERIIDFDLDFLSPPVFFSAILLLFAAFVRSVLGPSLSQIN